MRRPLGPDNDALFSRCVSLRYDHDLLLKQFISTWPVERECLPTERVMLPVKVLPEQISSS